MLFVGISGAFAQEIVFKCESKKACVAIETSYKFKVYKDGSYEQTIFISLGDGQGSGEKGYWYKECAGSGRKVADSYNVSVDKAVELLWTKTLGKSASSVSIDWND